MSSSEKYSVIGIMSGTSLDGVDLAFCEFEHNSGWEFEIKKAETVSYPRDLFEALSDATSLTKDRIDDLNIELGSYYGELVKDFANKHSLNPDFVSSHGHTVFHEPDKGITLQIGDGSTINKVCGYPVIYNFRSEDISKGGQGAPLVPIGDKLLFSDYEACVNFGGIANISYERDQKRIAFDICGVNIIFNHLANKLRLDYDDNGELASAGNVLPNVLDQLNSLSYYKLTPPKSLGIEWISENVFPLLDYLNPQDAMTTYAHHAATQISEVLNGLRGKCLFTGGGAYNSFFVEEIKKRTSLDIVLPESKIVDFKEALIFAFLGVLRMRNETNVLSSVTGASSDSCSGAIADN